MDELLTPDVLKALAEAGGQTAVLGVLGWRVWADLREGQRKQLRRIRTVHRVSHKAKADLSALAERVGALEREE